MDMAGKRIGRLKDKIYLVAKEVDLTGLGKDRRQVVAIDVMLNGEVTRAVIVAATEGDGPFADHAYGISDLVAVLINKR
jgi:hypothetical protein